MIASTSSITSSGGRVKRGSTQPTARGRPPGSKTHSISKINNIEALAAANIIKRNEYIVDGNGGFKISKPAIKNELSKPEYAELYKVKMFALKAHKLSELYAGKFIKIFFNLLLNVKILLNIIVMWHLN